MLSPVRKIIHVDMDAFYASVEQRDRPELKGQAVVVGGSPEGRGVIAAASYEARRFGVRSAMSSARALRLCPQLVFLRPDFTRYRAVSQQVHAIFLSVTDQIQPLALDEAYLDVTSNHLNETSATRLAEHIRARIATELRLTASAGVGPNKLVAKIASDHHKPNGLCVVPPDAVAEFLAPLPVRAIPGIGPATDERCKRHGLRTIMDLRSASIETLSACFGNFAQRYRDLAHGIDDRPVHRSRGRKSIGIEDTFADDLTTREQAEAQLEKLANQLEQRAARSASRGRTITLKVKYHDFRLTTRSRTLSDATAEAATLLAVCIQLLDETEVGLVPVRLLGITISHMDQDAAQQQRLSFD